MATDVSSVTKHFPSAEDGFTTTLASTISSGATTVPLNSVTGYSNGEVVVFIVDPDNATKKQTFTGTVDTAGVQITGVVWTSGTNQSHTAGSTVVDYESATAWSMVTKGLLVSHNQDGTIKDSALSSAAMIASGVVTTPKLSTELQKGWKDSYGGTTLPAPNTVTALGNRSYSLVFNSVDLTGALSPGMRLRTTRTVAAPTQCTSLNGTTQYYSKTTPAGMTFTDDFVVSAWIKLSSYPSGAQATIVSRYNGTSGWGFQIENATGKIVLVGYNGGAANLSYVRSYQSVPLNKWVHVSAQLDMSTFTASTTTSYIMIDGVDVPSEVLRGGTNPTALVQAGNLEIGSQNGGTNFFNGSIAQVAIYSAKVTQANVLATISQGLSGSETSLISAYSFNNSINDLNANANNLTAQGSAVATNADSPFGGQADGTISSTLDYCVITAASFSTNTTLTVRTSSSNTLPTSGGVSAVSYSTQASPYGMPSLSNIISEAIYGGSLTTTATSLSAVSGGQMTVTLPANKRVKISLKGSNITTSGAAPQIVQVGIYDSATQIALDAGVLTNAGNPMAGWRPEAKFHTGAGGAKTYNIYASAANAGTTTLTASATSLMYFTLELEQPW